MAEVDKTEFQFPDETVIDVSGGKKEESVKGAAPEPEIEIEVVDDTPPEDRGRKPMKEPPADVTDEELEQYSESVKKRIQHFSKGYHEERRAKEAALKEREEAIRFAQQVYEENKKLQGSVGQSQAALLEQAKKVVASEIEQAKQKLKTAHEEFDTDAIIEAQAELAKAVNRAERVNNFRPPALQTPETDVKTPTEPASLSPQPRVQVDEKARAWQDANPWFGTNKEMTAIALAVHENLVESGVNTASDEYYDKINSRVRSLFPDAFPQEKAPKKSPVAPATRSVAPKKITLTERQVQIAKRLGVPLELYAKKVAEEMRNQNG